MLGYNFEPHTKKAARRSVRPTGGLVFARIGVSYSSWRGQNAAVSIFCRGSSTIQLAILPVSRFRDLLRRTRWILSCYHPRFFSDSEATGILYQTLF